MPLTFIFAFHRVGKISDFFCRFIYCYLIGINFSRVLIFAKMAIFREIREINTNKVVCWFTTNEVARRLLLMI